MLTNRPNTLRILVCIAGMSVLAPTLPAVASVAAHQYDAASPFQPSPTTRVSAALSAEYDPPDHRPAEDLILPRPVRPITETPGSAPDRVSAPRRGGSFGGSRFSSADDFASEAFTRYQRYTYEAYGAALRAEARGRLVVPEGMSRATIIGQRVDAAARIRMRRWLRSEGIGEGPGELVQVNRWLRDPSGSGRYRLTRAFEEIRRGLAFLRGDLGEGIGRGALLRMIDESLDAYRKGDAVKGAHLLQAFEQQAFGGSSQGR